LIVAAKAFGVSVIRAVSGNSRCLNIYPQEVVVDYMVASLKECVELWEAHGVVVGIQNHNDFLKKPEETIANHPYVSTQIGWTDSWICLGSLSVPNAYQEIRKANPLCGQVRQFKEIVCEWRGEKTDLTKLMSS